MTVGIEWAILAVAVLVLLWGLNEKQRITRDSKSQLDTKLELIKIRQELGEERRRAESAEHELRTGPSPVGNLFSSISEMLDRVDEPPQVFHNGVLLAPGLDYTRNEETGDLRFMIPLRIRDVVQVRGYGGTLVILDHDVPVGEVLDLVPNVAVEDEVEVLEALAGAERKLFAEREPEEPPPASRYDRLAQDDEEQP